MSNVTEQPYRLHNKKYLWYLTVRKLLEPRALENGGWGSWREKVAFSLRGSEERREKRIKMNLPMFYMEVRGLRLVCELESEIGYVNDNGTDNSEQYLKPLLRENDNLKGC